MKKRKEKKRREEKRSLGFLILIICLMTILAQGCLQDKSSNLEIIPPISTTLREAKKHIQNVVNSINQEMKTNTRSGYYDFEQELTRQFGTPLWTQPVVFVEDEKLVYVIPIQEPNPEEEINAMLFLVMDEKYTDYFVYNRRMALELECTYGHKFGEMWMFDYFTYTVLNKIPQSGLCFQDIPQTQTRAVYFGEKCTESYVAVGDENGYEDYKGKHCWNTIIYETVFDLDGNGGAGGGLPDSGVIKEGEGGSTNQGYEDDLPRPYDESLKNPCDKANQLSTDTALINKVQEFISEATKQTINKTENGWIKTSTGKYISPSERKPKKVTYQINLKGCKISELYHTHPTGGPYPSWQDLNTLIDLYKKGNIHLKNFSYGVISEFGCLSLIIVDETKFKEFAENIDLMLAEYEQMIENRTKKDIDSVIAKFIDFLNAAQSGISVMFNTATYSDTGYTLAVWEAKESNGKQELSNTNCK